jgi:hypothetical protein
MMNHAGGFVLLASALAAETPEGFLGYVAEYGALGIVALFFLWVMPRMEEKREQRRAEQFKEMLETFLKLAADVVRAPRNNERR